MSKAEDFSRMNPSIELPSCTATAVLILVFDDDSVHVSVPKGTPDEGEMAIRSAADICGIGDGDTATPDEIGPIEASFLHQVAES